MNGLMVLAAAAASSAAHAGATSGTSSDAQADTVPSESAAPATPSPYAHLEPRAAELAEAVDAIANGDQSRDPASDLEKLTALEQAFDDYGAMPLIERGLLQSAIGASHFWLRDFDAAAARYASAARFFEDGQAPPEEMSGLYNNQAAILGSIGRFEEAETAHRKALAIRRELEPGGGVKTSSSLFGIGFVYFRLGRISESIPYLRQSAEMQLQFAPEGDALTVIRLTSLASVLGRAGREAEALDVAREAERIGRDYLGEDHPTYAVTVNNLGNSLIENGLYAEAIPVLRRAVDLRVAVSGEEFSGTAISLRNLATAINETGNAAEAETLNRRALEIFIASGEPDTPETLGYLYAELARFAAEREDWQSYADLAANALKEADARLSETDANRAVIHLYHAENLSRQGRFDEALAIAERWVPVVEAALIETHKDRIWAVLVRENLRQITGTEEASWDAADTAMAALEAKLSDFGISDRQLVREACGNREAALIYLRMAARAGDEDRSLRAVQLANLSELSLGQQLANTRADGLPTEEDRSGALRLRDRVFDLARERDELQARYSAALDTGDTEDAALLAERLTAVSNDKSIAEEQLRTRFPDYVQSYRPSALSIDSLLASLAREDILLMPVESRDSSWIVTLSHAGRLAIAELDGAAVASEVAAIRSAVDRPELAQAYSVAQAQRLHDRLFPGGVPQGSRILLNGGHALATIPLGLLVAEMDDNGPTYLVERASSKVVANLSLLGRDEGDRAGMDEVRVAGIGGALPPAGTGPGAGLASLFRSGAPAFRTIIDLPPLPNARAELEAIARALPGSQDLILVDADAREEEFKRTDLTGANVLAFATHGLVSGEIRDLWEPALLLGTADGSGEDGLLGASEIAALRLDADWVILSACNTAAGDTIGAPVYSGLATAFAQAGARALMLSHWRVRDDAAARLTVDTVRGAARGLSRAEALRQAQLALMADDSVPGAAHPAIWAPFVIIEN